MIEDEAPAHSEPAVTVTPDTVTAGTTVNDLVIQVEQPLFADPTVEFTMGPGILVDNLRILDDHTALADITVNSHIENLGHGVKVQTSTFAAAGCFDVDSPNPGTNSCPSVVVEPPVGLTSGEPFQVTIAVDDADADYPLVEVVVENENMGFDEVIFEDSPQAAYATPVTLTFDFDGLPPGNYVILGIAADKVRPFSGNLVEEPFQVSDIDVTPPRCEPTSMGQNAVGQGYFEILLRDPGSGLASVESLMAHGVALEIPEFVPGTRTSVAVKATVLGHARMPSVVLAATDQAGNTTRCDAAPFEPVAPEAPGREGVGQRIRN